jgi:hypothetical protein
VDLRLRNTANRCGFHRRFSLNISVREVPFVFHIDPVAEKAKSSSHKTRKDIPSFRRPGTKAQMWIKCADASALPAGSWPMSVTISGGDTSHLVAAHHDFASFTNCAAPEHLTSWKLSAEIIRAEIWMVRACMHSIVDEHTGVAS